MSTLIFNFYCVDENDYFFGKWDLGMICVTASSLQENLSEAIWVRGWK